MHRLVYEQRVRLALELLFTAAWGFTLVALFATSDTFNRMLAQQAQMLGPIYNLLDLDPLAQWSSIGLQHPLFFVGGGLFAIGMGIRAIAGELQDGSLALSITRPISRLRWFASQLAVIVPGSILLGAMYGVGCILAATVTTHQGTLHPAWMLLAGAEGGLVLLTFGALALLFSWRFGTTAVVLVVGVRLGCINHALLTEEAILARGLRLAGWVANRIDPAMPVADENIATLQARLKAPCLGTLPFMAATDPREAARRLTLERLV